MLMIMDMLGEQLWLSQVLFLFSSEQYQDRMEGGSGTSGTDVPISYQ